MLCFPLRIIVHLFVLPLPFSHCCSPLPVTLLFCCSHFCSTFRTIVLLFTSRYCFHLHVAWVPFLRYSSPLQLFFYFKYKVFHVVILIFVLLLLVCCYLLKNLMLPPCIPSCRNWEWLGVKNQKFVSIFPFAHFHFYFFNLMSFVPLFF